jgi:hypothetical protein
MLAALGLEPARAWGKTRPLAPPPGAGILAMALAHREISGFRLT